MVTCAYYDVSELEDPVLMARALERQPWPERRAKVERYRFAKDKRLCAGAGVLAADLLRQAGACDLTLGFGEHGKPYLSRHPALHFNLSHSGRLAVCAAADLPVGVDVETIQDHGEAVERYCCQASELAWLGRQADRARAFTSLWVRKESYIKLIGTGLTREPASFSVIGDDPELDDVRFAEWQVSDALLCVCTRGECAVELSPWGPFAGR